MDAPEVVRSQLDDDIFEITRVMNTYCWSLDTRDWERLATCFTNDLKFEASNMGRYDDPRALISAFQTRTIRIPIRRHLITNAYVRVDGDTAEFTSNLLNLRIRDTAPGGSFFISGGVYRNSFVRRAQGWKMSHLRWEARFIEGNTRMDPTLPPASYFPVMTSFKEAPWGGAVAAGNDGNRSPSQQVKDLCIGLFRALDAAADRDALLAFSRTAKGIVGGKAVSGGSDIIAALRNGTQGWTQHFFLNEKVAVAGAGGRYCAYVYRVVSKSGGDTNVHSGGVLMTSVTRTEAGWRVAELEYIPLWQRGTDITADPVRSMPGYERITEFPWELERTRERLRDEDEVVALMSKYTWCYDMWNFEKIKECFTEDVEGIFTTASTSSYSGRDSMIAGIRGNHELQPYMQHYCTNFIVDMGIDGESAEMKCYASTRRTEPGGGPVPMAGGRYDAYARKIDDEWRFVTFQYSRLHGPYD